MSSIRLDRGRKGTSPRLKPEEVQHLETGCEKTFWVSNWLASKIQLTQFCEKAYFEYRVAAGKKHKLLPDGADRWGTITLLCREYTLSRSFPNPKSWQLFPKAQSILDGHGIEVANPSIANPANTSYVVISRETERFVNEINDHKDKPRSSNELLTAEKGSNSSQETGALTSTIKTCASRASNPIGDSLFKKTVIPRSERKWITIEANPFPRSVLPTKYPRWSRRWFVITIRMNVKKMDHAIGKLWNHYCWEDLHRKEQEFFFDEYWIHLIQQGSSKTRIEYCLDNKKSIWYLRAIQGHSGGTPIKPEMMEYTLFPHNWKEYIFHREIVELSIHFGEWNNSWRKREWQSSTSSLLHTSESIR